jgi:hypothetical protein
MPSTPKFLAMNLQLQKRLVKEKVWACCPNCAYWLTQSSPNIMISQCDKFKMLPPLEVIVVGCEAWLSEVPF